MKKLLLLLSSAFLCLANSFAETETIDLTAQGFTNAQVVEAVTQGDVTLTFDKGTNSNAPKYYNTGSAVRCYGSNTITVSAKGASIKAVTLSFGDSDGSNEITANEGAFDGTNWSGEATEIVFTIGGTSGNRRIAKVEVTYGNGPAPVVVAKPTFSGETTFTESTTVTLAAEEGCKILYTFDDEEALEEWSEYDAPFTLTETTTVYAIAMDKDNNKSGVASQTYTKSSAINSIADIAGIEKGTTITLAFPMTAIYQNGSNLVVTDGTSNILVYGKTDNSYKNGDVIPAGATVTVSEYGGNKQLTPVSIAAGTEGTPVTPALVNADNIAEQGYLAYIKMENVSLAVSNKNVTITDAEGKTVAGYNQFGLNLAGIDADAKYDIEGVYGSYNGNKQFQFTNITSNEPPYVPTGDGTLANAYTVEDVKHLCATTEAPTEKVWVKGTIVGTASNGTTLNTEDKNAATNIAIGTSEYWVPVELPKGDVRTAINVVDNPENLGKDIWVYGVITTYFSVAGVKTISDFSWDGETGINTISTNSKTADGKYIENGKIVIVKNGKTYSVSGTSF